MVALVSLTVGLRFGWWLHGYLSVEPERADDSKPVVHVVAPSVPMVPKPPTTTDPQRHLVELMDHNGKLIKAIGITKRGYRISHPPGVYWELSGKSTHGVYQYRRMR